MAKTKNIFNFQGTLGDYTFYMYRGKQVVRRKSSLTAERFKKDKEFEAARKEGKIFGKASSASKFFRCSISPFDEISCDKTLHNRLTSIIRTEFHKNPETHPAGKPDWIALSKSLSQIEFDSGMKFDRKVSLTELYAICPDRTFLYIDFYKSPGSIFHRSPRNTHFRLHVVLAPITDATSRRNLQQVTDLSHEATWTSAWLPAAADLRLTQQIDIPQFMRNRGPVAILIVVEPGTQPGTQVEPAFSGRAIKLLTII